eukprot:763724-Hanusia_phi.AAC.4
MIVLREAGRQGGREARRHGGTEARREGGRQAGRQAGREAGREAGRQAALVALLHPRNHIVASWSSLMDKRGNPYENDNYVTGHLSMEKNMERILQNMPKVGELRGKTSVLHSKESLAALYNPSEDPDSPSPMDRSQKEGRNTVEMLRRAAESKMRTRLDLEAKVALLSHSFKDTQMLQMRSKERKEKLRHFFPKGISKFITKGPPKKPSTLQMRRLIKADMEEGKRTVQIIKDEQKLMAKFFKCNRQKLQTSLSTLDGVGTHGHGPSKPKRPMIRRMNQLGPSLPRKRGKSGDEGSWGWTREWMAGSNDACGERGGGAAGERGRERGSEGARERG